MTTSQVSEIAQPITEAQPTANGHPYKVLHVYRTYYPDTQGGLEEVVRQICSGTRDLGAQNRILTLSRDPDPELIQRPEADVYRCQLTFELASCGVSLAAFKAYKKHLEWADIVHFHFPWPFADVLNLVEPTNKPILVTYHSDIVRQRWLRTAYFPLMNRFLRSVDRIVCTSPNYFATSPVLSRFENKVDVVPIGLDMKTYPEASQTTADLSPNLAAVMSKPYFLFVGVLRYYKGLHILLDAIKDAPYNVVIAGSGPIEHKLKKQAAAQGLTNVEFTGHVSDELKVALFQKSLGLIFPSYLRSEAFGVTLLEGAMFGKPLISTEVGSGTSHVNVHDDTGLVVPPSSPKALRKAMDKLFHQPDMARLMGKRARARYELLFTGELMCRRYFEIYEDLLETDTPAMQQATGVSNI